VTTYHCKHYKGKVLRVRADKRPYWRSSHTSAMRQGGWYEDVRTVKDPGSTPPVMLPRTTLWTMFLWVLGLVKRWNPWV
jgi:hypothetical protein